MQQNEAKINYRGVYVMAAKDVYLAELRNLLWLLQAKQTGRHNIKHINDSIRRSKALVNILRIRYLISTKEVKKHG